MLPIPYQYIASIRKTVTIFVYCSKGDLNMRFLQKEQQLYSALKSNVHLSHTSQFHFFATQKCGLQSHINEFILFNVTHH